MKYLTKYWLIVPNLAYALMLGRNAWKHAKPIWDCEEGTNGGSGWGSEGAKRACVVCVR